MKQICLPDTPLGHADVRNMCVMAKLAIGRQHDDRKPTVVEIARFAERAFRMYFGSEVAGEKLAYGHHILIDAVAVQLLSDFKVGAP